MENTTKITNFTQLDAWKEGHHLVLSVYKITKEFPKEELLCLTNQIRRCAISITSNIAEGFSRQSYKEKLQFYSIALGSLTELQNQLYIARDILYLSEIVFTKIFDQSMLVHKILNGLIKRSKTIIHNT